MSDIVAIALDLGTTSIKAGLLDRSGTLSHIVTRPSPEINIHAGRYESDALAYAEAAEQVLDECIADAGDCRILGLCSQRSSFLIWERGTGQPVTSLISWQDNRGAARCVELHTHQKLIRELTGLPLTPYYFAAKLSRLLQESAVLRERLEKGELLAGMLDTYLLWRWTGGRHFVTDASMASRTLLMDIGSQQWSQQLYDLFGIPLQILPQIISSADIGLRLNNGLTLKASVGDQSAALLAGIAQDSDEAMVNLGTGCFVVRCLPADKIAAEGYLRTLVYQDHLHQPHFAIEGTLNSIAAALAPYPVSDCRIGELAQDEIFCLAEPSGLGAPYFRGDLGLRFSQSVEHLAQHRVAILLLEAIIFRVARILEDFNRDSKIKRVYLSGGLSELASLQQGIARCVPIEVYRLQQSESSLQGVALLAAGRASGFNRHADRISLTGDPLVLQKKYQGWKEWLDGLLQPGS